MDNFFFGLQAIMTDLIDLFRLIAAYQLFWGFSIGFLASTILHAFITSDDAKHVPLMAFSDKAKSFEKIYSRDPNSSYQHSYFAYSKNVDKLKTMLYVSGLFLIITLLIVFVSFR
jgi:hypothetical protein